MARFTTIPDIIAHIKGKFPHQRYLGKEYTVADLIEDLIEIDLDVEPHLDPVALARVFYGRDPKVPDSAEEPNDGT